MLVCGWGAQPLSFNLISLHHITNEWCAGIVVYNVLFNCYGCYRAVKVSVGLDEVETRQYLESALRDSPSMS